MILVSFFLEALLGTLDMTLESPSEKHSGEEKRVGEEEFRCDEMLLLVDEVSTTEGVVSLDTLDVSLAE